MTALRVYSTSLRCRRWCSPRVANGDALAQATLYVCRIDHPNDVIAAENLMEAMKLHGIHCRLIELGSKGYRPELQQCLRDPHAIGALGLNFQLDRSWSSEGTSFLDEASARRLPDVQWMLDHVSARWPQFTKSTATNSAYLFLSPYNENYFRRFILPDALTASIFSIGPNRRSRTEDLVKSYRERSIKCLIPINLRRLGDGKRPSLEDLRQSDPALHDAVSAAIEAARGDLLNPIEDHFLAALEAQGLAPPLTVFNSCIQVVDELTQEWRRRYVFEVARAYSGSDRHGRRIARAEDWRVGDLYQGQPLASDHQSSVFRVVRSSV